MLGRCLKGSEGPLGLVAFQTSESIARVQKALVLFCLHSLNPDLGACRWGDYTESEI